MHNFEAHIDDDGQGFVLLEAAAIFVPGTIYCVQNCTCSGQTAHFDG